MIQMVITTGFLTDIGEFAKLLFMGTEKEANVFPDFYAVFG